MGRVSVIKGEATVLEGAQVPLAAGSPRGTWVLKSNEEHHSSEGVQVRLRPREKVEGSWTSGEGVDIELSFGSIAGGDRVAKVARLTREACERCCQGRYGSSGVKRSI